MDTMTTDEMLNELEARRDALANEGTLSKWMKTRLGRSPAMTLDEIERDIRDVKRQAAEDAERPERERAHAKRQAELFAAYMKARQATAAIIDQLVAQQATNDALADAIAADCTTDAAITGAAVTVAGPFKGTRAKGVLTFWGRSEAGNLRERVARWTRLQS